MIRKIEEILLELSSTQNGGQYFIPDEYRDSSGKVNRQYLLTRDGFSLLVMGFTGQKALQWKLKYIEAFNSMEAALKNGFQAEPIQLQSLKETNKTLKFIQNPKLRDNIARQVLSKFYDLDIPLEDVINNTIEGDNSVKEFITSQCELIEGEYTKPTALNNSYIAWCKINGVKPVGKQVFCNTLRLAGLEQKVSRRMGDVSRYWHGIKIKDILS